MKEDFIKPMAAKDIRSIPKYILEKIWKLDIAECPTQKGPHRWYSYLTSIKGDLFKITVVAKTFYGKWHCKQVAARGVKSKTHWTKDMAHHRMAGYIVGWNPEGYKPHACRQWFADGKWYDDDVSKKGIKWNPFSLTINREYVGKFKEYQYSAHQQFQGDCIIDYLKLYLTYPQTEYLIKLGLHGLHDKVTILKRIGKDKQFCKWLITNRNEIAKEHCYAGVLLHAYKTGKPIKQSQKIAEFKKTFKTNTNIPSLQELFGKNLEQFYSYIAEQSTDPYSYIDYLKACKYLRLDMTRRQNRVPANFQKWHDRRIEQYNTTKARAEEKKRKEFYKQFATVAEKYLILQNCKKNVYLVFIAKSPAELIHEGEQLKHCVGRMHYEDKMVREETLIFFIRTLEQPDIPFVTIEYSLTSKKVLQCYGYQSKRPADDVLTFVNKVWLPYANRTIKKLVA